MSVSMYVFIVSVLCYYFIIMFDLYINMSYLPSPLYLFLHIICHYLFYMCLIYTPWILAQCIYLSTTIYILLNTYNYICSIVDRILFYSKLLLKTVTVNYVTKSLYFIITAYISNIMSYLPLLLDLYIILAIFYNLFYIYFIYIPWSQPILSILIHPHLHCFTLVYQSTGYNYTYLEALFHYYVYIKIVFLIISHWLLRSTLLFYILPLQFKLLYFTIITTKYYSYSCLIQSI